MIRVFLNICKGFQEIKHLNEPDIYRQLMDGARQAAHPCPFCGAPSDTFRRNGSYGRHLVCYHDGTVDDLIVRVPSLLCPSCHHSHALILSMVIPFSSFSLGFLLALFYARITGQFPCIPALCEHFGISERTYYRLRRCLVLDSKAFLDALDSFLEEAVPPRSVWPADRLRTADPVLVHRTLALFFACAGHSFLQLRGRFRPGGSLAHLPPGFCQIICQFPSGSPGAILGERR